MTNDWMRTGVCPSCNKRTVTAGNCIQCGWESLGRIMSKAKHVLKTSLLGLREDIQVILSDLELDRVPSRDVEGTFRVNCEVAMKKLYELRMGEGS